MAKMFYSLEEAAEKLGVDEQQVKDMAAEGQIQQFRDRDKLMFKRDEVDKLAGGASEASSESEAEAIDLDDTDTDIGVQSLDDTDMEGSSISLADSSDTDAIDLADETSEGMGDQPAKEDPREQTGISVFDTDEVDSADPMAQTQVTESFTEDELSLEGIGSGSGLLDLTRESDDTSLGAELIDEVQFGGEASDEKFDDMPSGLAGNFDSGELDLGPSASGLGMDESADSQIGGAAVSTGASQESMAMVSAPQSDPAGSGLGAGLLFGTFIALLLALVVMSGAIVGTPTVIQTALSSGYTPLITAVVLFVVALILGVVGMFIGKAAAR